MIKKSLRDLSTGLELYLLMSPITHDKVFASILSWILRKFKP